MKRNVSIDSNLLLLFTVGLTSRSYITRHKRLKAYTIEDFDILASVINGYEDIVLLPHTLTETSNLLRQIDNPMRSDIAHTLRHLILSYNEQHLPSRDAAARPEYTRLGLTDAVLLELSRVAEGRDQPTLLTVDLDLAIAAEIKGYKVENFNHYRDVP
jgi:hypothetical protein